MPECDTLMYVHHALAAFRVNDERDTVCSRYRRALRFRCVTESEGASAVAREKEMDTRKIVSLPAAMAQAITDFRFEERINTEAEAIRILLEAGLIAKGRAIEPKHPRKGGAAA